MIEFEEEKQLIAIGVRKTIETLGRSLHSEDDHGYDLYKWLQDQEKNIVNEACNKIIVGRAMLVD